MSLSVYPCCSARSTQSYRRSTYSQKLPTEQQPSLHHKSYSGSVTSTPPRSSHFPMLCESQSTEHVTSSQTSG